MSTFDLVSQMLSDVCDVDLDKIALDSNIIEDLGVDSLDFLDLTYEIDKKFGIKLPVEQWVEKINQGQAKVDDFFAMDKLVRNIETLAAR